MSQPSDQGIWAVVISDLPDYPNMRIKPVVYIHAPVEGVLVPYLIWMGRLASVEALHNPGGGRHLTLFDRRPQQSDVDACLDAALAEYMGGGQ